MVSTKVKMQRHSLLSTGANTDHAWADDCKGTRHFRFMITDRDGNNPSPDYSHYEGNSLHCVDRGATLEGRRHQRKCFIAFSALGTMLELPTGDFRDNLPSLPLQGTTALPSFRKGCTSIAVLPRTIRASFQPWRQSQQANEHDARRHLPLAEHYLSEVFIGSER